MWVCEVDMRLIEEGGVVEGVVDGVGEGIVKGVWGVGDGDCDGL